MLKKSKKVKHAAPQSWLSIRWTLTPSAKFKRFSAYQSKGVEPIEIHNKLMRSVCTVENEMRDELRRKLQLVHIIIHLFYSPMLVLSNQHLFSKLKKKKNNWPKDGSAPMKRLNISFKGSKRIWQLAGITWAHKYYYNVKINASNEMTIMQKDK